jgi:hypothetical protein
VSVRIDRFPVLPWVSRAAKLATTGLVFAF